MTIGWGLIGIGTHANRFLGPAIVQSFDTSFVAVCGRSPERARDFAARHGVKRWYDSYEKMLEDPEVDVVLVATPNNLHAQNTVQAAKARKHVLCEKPMALTEEDCMQMIKACKENGVKLGVDYQNRYHPAHIEARRLIQDGTVGEIKVVCARYCSGFMRGRWKGGWRDDPEITGAGALMATAVHPVDLLRFVMDTEIDEVQAACVTQTPFHSVDEMVYSILKFKNGAYGTVVSGILAPRSDNDMIIYGSQAKITCKGTIAMPLQGELFVEGDSINIRMNFPVPDPVPASYIRLIEGFNRYIRDKAAFESSATNGLQMTRITSAILESSRLQKVVKVEN